MLGIINDSEADVADFFFGDDVVRTMHICIDGTSDEKMALANELCGRIRIGDDIFALAQEYSSDYAALGNMGDHIVRGDYIAEYEDIAFSMSPDDDPQIVVIDDQIYIICVLEKDMTYFMNEYASVYYTYVYSELDEIILDQRDSMYAKKTDFGKSLDLVTIK